MVENPSHWHFAHHIFHVDCLRIETTCAMVQPLNKVKISLTVLLKNGCNDPTVGTAALHKVNGISSQIHIQLTQTSTHNTNARHNNLYVKSCGKESIQNNNNSFHLKIIRITWVDNISNSERLL